MIEINSYILNNWFYLSKTEIIININQNDLLLVLIINC